MPRVGAAGAAAIWVTRGSGAAERAAATRRGFTGGRSGELLRDAGAAVAPPLAAPDLANAASCCGVMLYQSAGAAITRVLPSTCCAVIEFIERGSGELARELARELVRDAGCEVGRDTAGEGVGGGGGCATRARAERGTWGARPRVVAGVPLPSPSSAAARFSACASSAEFTAPRLKLWPELVRLGTGVEVGVRGTAPVTVLLAGWRALAGLAAAAGPGEDLLSPAPASGGLEMTSSVPSSRYAMTLSQETQRSCGVGQRHCRTV